MPTAVILCLANSRKLAGRCAAGLRIDGTGWVRMVSKLEHGILNATHLFLDNGKEAAVLDVLEVGLVKPKPDIHQPENWLLDNSIWKLYARQNPADYAGILRAAIVPGADLLGGRTDRVAWAELEQRRAPASLTLVAPDRLELLVIKKPDGRHQVRGRFCLGSVEFNLSMTDPVWEKNVLQEGPQRLVQTDRKFVLSISLGEPFNGYCYKVIATVLPLPPALTALF